MSRDIRGAIERRSPPSTYAVAAAISGQPGGVAQLVGVTMLRAVLMLPGIWIGSRLVGKLNFWQTVGMTALASTSITFGMMAYYWLAAPKLFSNGPSQQPAGGAQDSTMTSAAVGLEALRYSSRR